MLSSLLWFGTDYGPGDPMRWSPTAAEILLLDWIPRKIMADVEVPGECAGLLRAFVRFCHHERGIRPGLTDETIAAIDEFEPEYQRAHPLGPAAGTRGAAGGHGRPRRRAIRTSCRGEVAGEIMLDGLRRGGRRRGGARRARYGAAAGGAVRWDVDAGGRARPCRRGTRSRGARLHGSARRQYRTACRRLLADAAAGDPEIFRRRGKANTDRRGRLWIAGKTNSLFDPRDRAEAAGQAADPVLRGDGVRVSQRSGTLLRAIGVEPHNRYGRMDLGTPRYLTGNGAHRSWPIATGIGRWRTDEAQPHPTTRERRTILVQSCADTMVRHSRRVTQMVRPWGARAAAACRRTSPSDRDAGGGDSPDAIDRPPRLAGSGQSHGPSSGGARCRARRRRAPAASYHGLERRRPEPVRRADGSRVAAARRAGGGVRSGPSDGGG